LTAVIDLFEAGKLHKTRETPRRPIVDHEVLPFEIRETYCLALEVG
jgi:hypothetical protein